jgi:SAM-dependent methyltransferase
VSSIDVSFRHNRSTANERASAGRPVIAQAIAAFEGNETSPRWHSQWAWDNYERLVVDLANRFGLREVCEIGGGRDPIFSPAEAERSNIDLIVNDIDSGELALTPRGLRTARFDVAGDLSEIGAPANSYDMMISRMVFEHIDGTPQAWSNIHRLLRPGGIGLAFFPTMYAWPFVINRMIPEVASRAILQALFPNRADGGDDPKFPALYDHCYSGRKLTGMLDRIGFSEVHVMPFWGHGYLKSFPVIREIEGGLNRLGAMADLRVMTTYAFALVRK